MSAPKSPESIRRSVRTMAILTALLGPLLVVTSLLPPALQQLLERLGARSALHQNKALVDLEFLFDVSARSAPILVPLGVLFLVAGISSRRGVEPSVRWLRAAAWAGAVAMALVGVVWLWVGLERQASPGIYWGGVLGHGVQAYLVYRAARYLGRPDVRAALTDAP